MVRREQRHWCHERRRRGLMQAWDDYFAKTRGRPLRPLYLRALPFLPNTGKALDLGCGLGIEAIDLLGRNFAVTAIDKDAEAIEHLSALAPSIQAIKGSLEEMQFGPPVDFLYAYHSLPFLSSPHFDAVLEKAAQAVKPGGLLGASFFGPDDDWVKQGVATGISLPRLQNKLKAFTLLHVDESRKIGSSAVNGEKLWHLIEIIARKGLDS